MLKQWVFWLLVVAGFAYVSGNTCNSTAALACYTDLVHYESLAFPLYGADEEQLEDTCRNINRSFTCIGQFAEKCSGTPECDEECQDLIRDMRSFISNTGLRKLENELCDSYSAIRQIYLDNVECLEQNADMYASCHNDSQKSQHYLNSQAHGIEERCCFFVWYTDCFTNKTRDHCEENATFFVSFAMHHLIGDIQNLICHSVDVTCTTPPMKSDDDDGEDDKDEQNKKDTTKNISDDEDEWHSKYPATNIADDEDKQYTKDPSKNMDDDKLYTKDPTKNIDDDIDNSIDVSENAASIRSHIVNWILLPYLYIVLSKLIL